MALPGFGFHLQSLPCLSKKIWAEGLCLRALSMQSKDEVRNTSTVSQVRCPLRKPWTLEFLKPFSFWRKEYILFNYLCKKRRWMLIFSINVRKINSKIILNLQLPGISALLCTASDNKYSIMYYVQSMCAYAHIYIHICVYICIHIYICIYILKQ